MENHDRSTAETAAARMSNDVGPFLRIGTQELLDSSRFSDLTIICEDTYFQVHKAVLFAHGGKFREIAEQAHAAVTLYDDDSVVLNMVIQYLYRLDLIMPPPGEGADVRFAAEVYLTATKYGVQGLPQLALAKFAATCQLERHLDFFISRIRLAEERMANGDDELWRALSRIAEAQLDVLEEQRESGGLSDHDQKSLDNLLGNVRAGDHPASYEGFSDGGRDGDDEVDGGGAAEDDMSPAVDDQTPIIEAPIPEQRTYVPPHRRHQHPVGVQKDEEELQKKRGPGQLNAAASAFVPSFASPAQEAEANQKSEETTHQEEQVQTGNRTPPPGMADHEKWKDEPNQWADPAVSSPPAKEGNYGLTNSPRNNGDYGTTRGSSQPRAAEDSFQGPGIPLGTSAVGQAGCEKKAKASRLLDLGKTKTPSPAFNRKYGPGA